MAMMTAATLFAIFVVNVILGAMRGGEFLSDVGEMVLLVATSIAFVIVILQREASRKKDNQG